MSTESIEGHCLCGAVVFAYTGAPNWVAHCHCESCRRATSSPMTTWVSVPRTQFRYVQGAPQYYQSSPTAKRGFCGSCGSPLTYEPDSLPDEIHLYAALLRDASVVTPDRHVFVDEQLTWFETADTLPRFATTSGGGAYPIRSKPR